MLHNNIITITILSCMFMCAVRLLFSLFFSFSVGVRVCVCFHSSMSTSEHVLAQKFLSRPPIVYGIYFELKSRNCGPNEQTVFKFITSCDIKIGLLADGKQPKSLFPLFFLAFIALIGACKIANACVLSVEKKNINFERNDMKLNE